MKGTSGEELYLGILTLYIPEAKHPTPQQGGLELNNVYKYIQSYKESNSALEKEIFPVLFGEDSVPLLVPFSGHSKPCARL